MTIALMENPTVSPTLDGDHERFAHIVVEGFWPKDETGELTGEFVAETPVADGMVFGTPVKALCGKVWVPDKDPTKYPLCPTCVDVAEQHGWKVPQA